MTTYMLPAFLTRFLLVGCSTVSFDKLLDSNADYDGSHRINAQLDSSRGALYGPRRVEAKLTDVYMHPHEMSGGDYFLGGWIRTLVSHAYWDGSGPTFQKVPPKRPGPPKR